MRWSSLFPLIILASHAWLVSASSCSKHRACGFGRVSAACTTRRTSFAPTLPQNMGFQCPTCSYLGLTSCNCGESWSSCLDSADECMGEAEADRLRLRNRVRKLARVQRDRASPHRLLRTTAILKPYCPRPHLITNHMTWGSHPVLPHWVTTRGTCGLHYTGPATP